MYSSFSSLFYGFLCSIFMSETSKEWPSHIVVEPSKEHYIECISSHSWAMSHTSIKLLLIFSTKISLKTIEMIQTSVEGMQRQVVLETLKCKNCSTCHHHQLHLCLHHLILIPNTLSIILHTIPQWWIVCCRIGNEASWHHWNTSSTTVGGLLFAFWAHFYPGAQGLAYRVYT
jgi:hypothetical protein